MTNRLGSSSSSSSEMTDRKFSMGSTNRASTIGRRASVVSHASTLKRGQCEECRDRRQEQMEMSINRPALLEVASAKRNGLKTRFGRKIDSNFNYLLEIIFEDDVSWLARIPKPWRCSNPEEMMYSEMSTFKFLKSKSKIPVPEVYGYDFESNRDNAVGVTYMLVQKLPGFKVPELSMGNKDLDLQRASRFHSQLADVILELGTFKFDKIGSLRESKTEPGIFEVAPLYDFYTTYPLARGQTQQNRGPFSSTSEYFNALSDLNIKDTLTNYSPKSQQGPPADQEIARFHLIKKMIPAFTENASNEGPFYLQHLDLTAENILVDEECNITGVLDFNGFIGPLPNLARYPELIYQTKLRGPLFNRKLYQQTYLSRDAPETSVLSDKNLRATLMTTAHKVWMFENSLNYPAHKSLNLAGRGGLYEFVFHDTKFSEKQAFMKLADEDASFQKDCPRSSDGTYSWEMDGNNVKMGRARANTVSSGFTEKSQLKAKWENAPWIKGRREDERIREYVRVHKHLPPDVQAEPGKIRNNGPEKAFRMAWKFIKCR